MPNNVRNLRIQWKGVISGPFSRAELDELLENGTVSLIHRIESNGRWSSVGDFLQRRTLGNRNANDTASGEMALSPLPSFSAENKGEIRHLPHMHRMEKLVLIGYILCGTTFVLPLFATVPALLLAFRVQAEGAREPARIQFFLCTAFTILGIIFWFLFWHMKRSGFM